MCNNSSQTKGDGDLVTNHVTLFHLNKQFIYLNKLKALLWNRTRTSWHEYSEGKKCRKRYIEEANSEGSKAILMERRDRVGRLCTVFIYSNRYL